MAWWRSIIANAVGSNSSVCREAGIGQRSQVVLSSIEVSERAEFLIHRYHFFRPHASGANGIEEKHRPQSILRKQRFNVGQDAATVYSGEGMRKAVDFHDSNVLVA